MERLLTTKYTKRHENKHNPKIVFLKGYSDKMRIPFFVKFRVFRGSL